MEKQAVTFKGLLQAAIVVTFLVLACLFFTSSGSNQSVKNGVSPTTKESQQTPLTTDDFNLPEDKVVNFATDVLWALDDYYMSTQNQLSDESQMVDYMTDLLNQRKYLESGNILIEKYLNDQNEVIKVTSLGMITGSKKIINAGDELLQFLRRSDPNNPDQLSEYEYSIAKYISDEKEGYKLISISAPQMTLLMFKGAETKNPTGKIPYKISLESRERLLQVIDKHFSDALKEYWSNVTNKSGKYNAVILAVNGIRNNILPETYEESEKLVR